MQVATSATSALTVANVFFAHASQFNNSLTVSVEVSEFGCTSHIFVGPGAKNQHTVLSRCTTDTEAVASDLQRCWRRVRLPERQRTST